MPDALVTQWMEEAARLRHYGAEGQAAAVEACARDLVEWFKQRESTLTVKDAAALAGVAEETVRRAVRSREIEDLRTHPRGAIRVKSGDVDFLKGRARAKPSSPPSGYDPARHASRLLGQL